MKLSVLFVAAMMFIVPASAHSWELSFGNDKENVGYREPISDEDFPVGPASYRIVGQDLWVLDSANARVKIYDASGRFKKDFAVPGLRPNYIIDDFAVVPGSSDVVVADGANREIVKLSDTGKELQRIKIDSDQIIQLDEIAVDSKGQIYVGDYAMASISVFSESGNLLRTIPWGISGFAVDKDDNLHTVSFTEGKGHDLVKISSAGDEVSRVHIGMVDVQNPRMWHVSAKGEVLFSVIPNLGDPVKQWLFRMSAGGEILNKAEFKNPYYIKRYLIFDDESVRVVKADYGNKSGKITFELIK